jgi:hypothetical protein
MSTIVQFHQGEDEALQEDAYGQAARHSLPSQFDDTVQFLMNEMEIPQTRAEHASVSEHHLLAALLLQGAYTVVR